MNKLLQSMLVLLVLPHLCLATTQICDRLIFEGSEYSGDYDEFPLEDYWSEENSKPDFLSGTSTACWRGYIATWELQNQTLFLKALSRWNNPVDGETQIPLQKVFSGVNGPIPANWFQEY